MRFHLGYIRSSQVRLSGQALTDLGLQVEMLEGGQIRVAGMQRQHEILHTGHFLIELNGRGRGDDSWKKMGFAPVP